MANTRTRNYVTLVVTAAICSAAALIVVAPNIEQSSIDSTALRCGLALVAEAMGLAFSKSVTGSLAFIPYLASIIVAPNWMTLLGVTAVRLLFERRRETIKAIFNVAAHAFTIAATILLYRALGGQPVAGLRNSSLLDISRLVGWQAMVTIVLSVAMNSALVTGVIAANTDKPAKLVWRENYLTTLTVR